MSRLDKILHSNAAPERAREALRAEITDALRAEEASRTKQNYEGKLFRVDLSYSEKDKFILKLQVPSHNISYKSHDASLAIAKELEAVKHGTFRAADDPNPTKYKKKYRKGDASTHYFRAGSAEDLIGAVNQVLSPAIEKIDPEQHMSAGRAR